MSFSQSYHPNHTAPAPVRVMCDITKGPPMDQGGAVYGYRIEIFHRHVRNPNGGATLGVSGSLVAGDQDNAEAQIYGKVIDELATLLANELSRAD